MWWAAGRRPALPTPLSTAPQTEGGSPVHHGILEPRAPPVAHDGQAELGGGHVLGVGAGVVCRPRLADVNPVLPPPVVLPWGRERATAAAARSGSGAANERGVAPTSRQARPAGRQPGGACPKLPSSEGTLTPHPHLPTCVVGQRLADAARVGRVEQEQAALEVRQARALAGGRAKERRGAVLVGREHGRHNLREREGRSRVSHQRAYRIMQTGQQGDLSDPSSASIVKEEEEKA